MTKINKKTFYILSFTWGLPMSLIGLIVCGFLMMCGKKIKKFGHAYYIEVGVGGSGCEFGWFFVVNKGTSDNLKAHELGHAYQNIVFGWLMPFIVCIPSATRYWWRRFRQKIGKPCASGYYDIWFEKQASTIGKAVINGKT